VSLGGCSVPDGELLNFHNDQGFVYCSGRIYNGFTSCNAQIFLGPGIYTARAGYPGDQQFEPSVSTNYAGGLGVSKWNSRATLTANPNPGHVGQPVTITATVSSAGPYVPTGHVLFYVAGKFVRQVSLTNGTAQTSYTFARAGNWTIGATYGGDAANYGTPQGAYSSPKWSIRKKQVKDEPLPAGPQM
jgi:hypothetical protein